MHPRDLFVVLLQSGAAKSLELAMRILGYILCALAALIGAIAILDTYFHEHAHQIWVYLDIVMFIALAICLILGIRNLLAADKSGPLSLKILPTVFAFIVFTETWVEFMAGTTLAPMQWLWIDAIVVIALLHVGMGLLSHEAESASDE